MLENGYISLHRSLLNWEWYDDANTTRLFIHLLLTVNHYDASWHGMTIKRGSRITSLRKLSEETGLSIAKIRNSINRLKSTHEITHETTHDYSLITVVNYSKYQDVSKKNNTPNNTQDNTPTTHERQQSNNNNNNNKYIYLSENLPILTDYVKNIYHGIDDRQIDIIGNLLFDYNLEDIKDVVIKTALRTDVENPVNYILTSIKKYKKRGV